MEQSKFYRIRSVTEHEYALVGCDGSVITRPIQDVDKSASAFTIQDAKDGDVLADGNLPFIFKKIDSNKYSYAYCGISVDDGFKIESDGKSGEWTWMQDMKPATKIQRDLLFQKMHDAGYEWDADKKELKKIEQKSSEEYNITGIGSKNAQGKLGEMIRKLKPVNEVLEQKPAEWSEKDERMFKNTIALIETLEDYNKAHDGFGDVKFWFKSLKERYSWRPSEEQIKALNYVINIMASSESPKENDYYYNVFKDLREQLKKLKG